MKTTTWLCPALTLLCAANLVYTAQRGNYGEYPLESMGSLQKFFPKRDRPSLSIVNPLDVLRQRLLLELARKQMKENSRQVERNRVILKNVGKRMASKYTSPITAALYDVHELQKQQQQDAMKHLQPYEYELIPTTLIFDYLQEQQQRQQQQQLRHPWMSYDSNTSPFVNNYINEDIIEAALSSPNTMENDAEIGEGNAEPDIIAFNGIVSNANKNSLKQIKQSNNEHSANKPSEQQEATDFQKSFNNRNDHTKHFTLINNHQQQRNKNDLTLENNDENLLAAKHTENEQINDNDGDYQLQRYFYRLHKNQNHLARK